MANLGQTSMTSGSSINGFDVNTGSNKYVSDVKLDCKGKVRCSGVIIGDFTSTDAQGKTDTTGKLDWWDSSFDPKSALLVADGSCKDLNQLLPIKGKSYIPVYIKGNSIQENDDSDTEISGGITECTIFSGSDPGIISTSDGHAADLPTTLYFKSNSNSYGSLHVAQNTASIYEFSIKPPTNGTATLSCNGGFFQTSDIRKKENFRDLDLDKCYKLIDKCQTVLFDYKEGAKDQMGMIAQEVEEFFPEIVSTDADGFKSLDYAKLTVIVLRVLKDLIKKVNVRTDY